MLFIMYIITAWLMVKEKQNTKIIKTKISVFSCVAVEVCVEYVEFALRVARLADLGQGSERRRKV